MDMPWRRMAAPLERPSASSGAGGALTRLARPGPFQRSPRHLKSGACGRVMSCAALVVFFSHIEILPMDAAVADISFGHFENAEQIAFWNGAGGERWVARRAELDAMLAPVQAALLERAAIQPGERVLDIGCGCGATLIAAAEQAGPGGTVLGLDVSAAMLTCAHELAPADAPVSFVQGDAMVHHFKAASADLVLSRLGVMYCSAAR